MKKNLNYVIKTDAGVQTTAEELADNVHNNLLQTETELPSSFNYLNEYDLGNVCNARQQMENWLSDDYSTFMDFSHYELSAKYDKDDVIQEAIDYLQELIEESVRQGELTIKIDEEELY